MRLLIAGLVGLLAGCGAAPTTVLLTVTLPDGAAPAAMSASVYDRFGALALDAPISHPGAGTLIVRNLPDQAQSLRIVVQASPLLGGVRVDTVAHQQVTATVALSSTTPDRDHDGVPDALDDCPDVPDADQASAAGDGTGDACRNADLSMIDAPVDAGGADGADMTPVVLFDDEFNGTTLVNWSESLTGPGTATLVGGYLNIALPAVANVTVDISTTQKFAVGTSVHMRVNLSAGQNYDHHALGYSNAAVSSNCGFGETEAAIFRGQDTDRYLETNLANAYTCDVYQLSYPAGFRVLEIYRRANSVDFYEDGALVRSVTTTLSTAALPIRLSAYTFTTAPATPISLQIDYVRVTKP